MKKSKQRVGIESHLILLPSPRLRLWKVAKSDAILPVISGICSRVLVAALLRKVANLIAEHLVISGIAREVLGAAHLRKLANLDTIL